MAENAYKIAHWNSRRNPLEHVCGNLCICPTLMARGQDNNAQMILVCRDFDNERDLKYLFLDNN